MIKPFECFSPWSPWSPWFKPFLFHHGLVVHGSGQNQSDELRTTLIIQYAAADAFAYTAPVVDSRHRNAMVRGEASRYARVEVGTIELPPDFSAGYTGIYKLQAPDRM